MIASSTRLRAWRIAAALALAINLWFMYAPRVPGPGGGLRLDLVGHAFTFAALTFTALMARVPPAWVLALAALNAVASETVQALFLVNRSGDWTDLAADAVGITLGYLLWRRVSRDGEPARHDRDQSDPGTS